MNNFSRRSGMRKVNSLFIKRGSYGCMVAIFGLMTVMTGCNSNSKGVAQLEQERTTQSQQLSTQLSGELSIAVYQKDEYLDWAAQQYQQSHKDVKININTYIGENEATQKNQDQYMQVLNTAFVSGKGDDIFDVEPISYFKLADKNMLADLEEYLKDQLNEQDYYMSILDAYLLQGKRYTLPLSFVMESYSIDPKVSASLQVKSEVPYLNLQTLLNFSESVPNDKTVMLFDDSGSGMDDVSLAHRLFCANKDQFINMDTKEVTVDNDSFCSLLEGVKKISTKECLVTRKGYQNNQQFYTQGTQSLINQYNLYSPAMCHNGTVDYTNLELKLIANDKGESSFETIGFMPAINTNSSNKELAADFIKFLLSEQAQASTKLLFCPVNKKAVVEYSKLLMNDVKAEGYLPEGFNQDTLNANIEIFNQLAQSNTLSELDRTMNGFVLDELQKFFLDQQTSQQAAKNLQSKLTTYLKE